MDRTAGKAGQGRELNHWHRGMHARAQKSTRQRNANFDHLFGKSNTDAGLRLYLSG